MLGKLAVTSLLLLLAVGCSGSSDKAGGADEETVVLTFANHEPENSDFEHWIAAVEELSEGSIRVDVRNHWRDLDRNYEVHTIADLRAGKVHLAKIGARAWDLVGVTSFQALVAPFLVDSYELEASVLESELAERMLAELDRLDLVGLAILPGALRKPFGVKRVLTRPDDFRGARIGIRPGAVAEATIRALGAHPVSYVAGSGREVAALDGAELDTVIAVQYASLGMALTANVNLWPRAVTIVMNKRSFAALGARQRDALREAGAHALAPTLEFVRANAAEKGVALCQGGLRLARASQSDLAGLRKAVEPAYAELSSDSLTAELIEKIGALKRAAPGPDSPTCARRDRRSTAAASELDGVYRSQVTREELLAHPAYDSGEDNPGNYGDFRLEFAQGRFEWTGSADGVPMGGAFSVDGDRVTLKPEYPAEVSGLTFVYRWSRYRDTVSFTKVTGGPTLLVVHPWRRT